MPPISEKKTGFLVTAHKRIDGRLIARKRTVATRGEARRLEKQFKEELNEIKMRHSLGAPFWPDAVEKYLANAELSPSTMQVRAAMLRGHTKQWAKKTIDSIYRNDVKALIEEELPEHSPATRDDFRKYLSYVFKQYADSGIISENPARGFSLLGRKKFNHLICMSQPEIKVLLSAAKKIEHEWYPIWRVVYQTAVRSGEGYALCWTDVDFVNKRLSVNKSYCWKAKAIGPTKSGEPRSVPLSDDLLAFLKEYKLTRGDSQFVFPRFSAWKVGDAAKILRDFQNELGIRLTNFHSLRASFITHLLLNGIPVTKVQQIVGHKDLKTTQRYVRLVAADLDGATDVLDLNLSNNIADIVNINR